MEVIRPKTGLEVSDHILDTQWNATCQAVIHFPARVDRDPVRRKTTDINHQSTPILDFRFSSAQQSPQILGVIARCTNALNMASPAMLVNKKPPEFPAVFLSLAEAVPPPRFELGL